MKFILLILVNKACSIGIKKFEGSKYGVFRISTCRKTKYHPTSSENLSSKKSKDLFEYLCKALTIEFLPKKSQEHSEVDGALPFIQHLIQLLVFDIKFS